MEEFTDILDTALNRVHAGEPPESVLASYPDQVEQLTPLLEGALALQTLHPVVMPNDESMRQQRHTFLDQLASLQDTPVSPGRLERLKGQIQAAIAGLLPATPYLLRRPREVRSMSTIVVQFLVIVALVTGAVGGTAAATARSLPGSALYGIKLDVEDARLAFNSDPQRAAEMHMAFAGERVKEMKQVAQAGEKVERQTRLRLERHLENALRLAAQVGDDGQMVGLLQRMQLRYQAYDNELAELQVRVQQRAGSELAQARRRLEQAAQAAGDGMDNPDQYRWRYAHNRNEEAPPFWEEHEPAVPGQAGNRDGQPEGAPNQGDENRNQHEYGPPQDAPGPGGTPNEGDENRNQHEYGPPEDAPGPGDTPNEGDENHNQHQYGAPEDAPGPGGTPNQGEDNQQQNGAPAEAPGGQDTGNDSGQEGDQQGSGSNGSGSGGGSGGGN